VTTVDFAGRRPTSFSTTRTATTVACATRIWSKITMERLCSFLSLIMYGFYNNYICFNSVPLTTFIHHNVFFSALVGNHWVLENYSAQFARRKCTRVVKAPFWLPVTTTYTAPAGPSFRIIKPNAQCAEIGKDVPGRIILSVTSSQILN